MLREIPIQGLKKLVNFDEGNPETREPKSSAEFEYLQELRFSRRVVFRLEILIPE